MSGKLNGIVEETNTRSIRDKISPYVKSWPIFLVSLLICIGIAVIYLRYTVPKYMATTSFLVIELDGESTGSKDIIEHAMNGKSEVNLSSEIMQVSSKSLMERTISKNDFNIAYYIKGRIHSVEIYKEAPFTLVLNKTDNPFDTYKITLRSLDSVGGKYSVGNNEDEPFQSFQWGKTIGHKGQHFVLQLKRPIQAGDGEYIVRWQPVEVTAAEFLNNLAVRPFDSKTNAIHISFRSENIELGKDVLNALFKEFNLMDIEERNRLSESTVQFIDERLLNISKELKGVEGTLENYQGNNRLVDIKGQSSMSLESSNEVTKTIKDISIQQGVASMILNYFSNPVNSGKLVPSSLGLNDETLASLITKYNEVQLKRERETPFLAPSSTVMQDYNAQLGHLKSSILESLNNINKNLRLQETNFRQQNSQYQNFLSSIPHNERVLQEIKRKQSITEGLYLYLLQKREEAAISSTASSIPHYKQIDSAEGYGKVEPNSKNILIASMLLGFFLAFGIAYGRSLFNDKISTRDDIFKVTSLPLLGEISHLPKIKTQLIARMMDRSLVGEQFRSIRTNLTFLLKDRKKKVILVTSSSSGEGKSFTSLNLAAVYALPGKKIALLEFDVRKPIIHTHLNLDNSVGLTSFLNGEVTELVDIVQPSDSIPNLHIYPAGPVPLNPADILSSARMSILFEMLKSRYDYVIVDSPPALLVSDPFILAEYSDIIIYILRSHKTSKKQLGYLDELVGNKSLSNVKLILNDLRLPGTDKKYSGYYTYNGSNGVEKVGKSLV